ncbi:heterokaryon incompatibility protein-domain-containing protein [Xylariaceae sp. FL0255]|nr:heterokaryon incompatibility protein-domain-containing protein [Xylariaceae sp. FL0255]
MYLLNITALELEQFIGRDKPHYAILSHTGGEDEVLFDDIHPRTADKEWTKKMGAAKVLKATSITQATATQLDGKCSINKSNSAELSEAINSMFHWYSEATVCYAYLSDVGIHSKMTWARTRESTRPEDMAYSLLGLFGVNMPLLYGEGKEKAFRRLQGEICKQTNDQSALLNNGLYWPWISSVADFSPSLIFLKSPSAER